MSACPTCGEHLRNAASVMRCMRKHPLCPGDTDEDRVRRAGGAERAVALNGWADAEKSYRPPAYIPLGEHRPPCSCARADERTDPERCEVCWGWRADWARFFKTLARARRAPA